MNYKTEYKDQMFFIDRRVFTFQGAIKDRFEDSSRKRYEVMCPTNSFTQRKKFEKKNVDLKKYESQGFLRALLNYHNTIVRIQNILDKAHNELSSEIILLEFLKNKLCKYYEEKEFRRDQVIVMINELYEFFEGGKNISLSSPFEKEQE